MKKTIILTALFLLLMCNVYGLTAGEKHTTLNRSDKDLRYLEFFTCPPITADFVEVK